MKTVGEVLHDGEMLFLQKRRVALFEDQGEENLSIRRRRAWHLWGIALISVGFLGLAILVGAGMIADSLDAYCPVDAEVIYRPA